MYQLLCRLPIATTICTNMYQLLWRLPIANCYVGLYVPTRLYVPIAMLSPWPWPRVLENWPVLGTKTALSFELLKFCGALENFFEKRFLVIAWKIFVKTFFFFAEHLCLCPWSLASSIPVLGLESVCSRKGCPWPWSRIFFVSLA